jgi:hypothetical protein
MGDKDKGRGKAKGGGGAAKAKPKPAPAAAPAPAPAPAADLGPATAGGVVGMSSLTAEEKRVIDGYSDVDYKRINSVVGGGVPAVGSTLSDRGFFSTSHKRSVAEVSFAGDMMITINAPRGARAVDVTHVAGGNEKEILFGRNVNMRVTSVRSVGGKTEVTVDMLP